MIRVGLSTNQTKNAATRENGIKSERERERRNKVEISNEQYTKEADVQRKIWKESKYFHLWSLYTLSQLTSFVIAVCILFMFFLAFRFELDFISLFLFFSFLKEKICCVKLVASFSVLYLYSTWKSIYNLSVGVGVCLCSMHAYTHVLYICCIYHTIHLKYKPHRVRRTSGIKNTRKTAFEFAFQHINKHVVVWMIWSLYIHCRHPFNFLIENHWSCRHMTYTINDLVVSKKCLQI